MLDCVPSDKGSIPFIQPITTQEVFTMTYELYLVLGFFLLLVLTGVVIFIAYLLCSIKRTFEHGIFQKKENWMYSAYREYWKNEEDKKK